MTEVRKKGVKQENSEVKPKRKTPTKKTEKISEKTSSEEIMNIMNSDNTVVVDKVVENTKKENTVKVSTFTETIEVKKPPEPKMERRPHPEPTIKERPPRDLRIPNIVGTPNNKDLYTRYQTDLKIEFEILYRGNTIFDSLISKRDNLRFENDYFIIFGKKMLYNGTRIIKKG